MTKKGFLKEFINKFKKPIEKGNLQPARTITEQDVKAALSSVEKLNYFFATPGHANEKIKNKGLQDGWYFIYKDVSTFHLVVSHNRATRSYQIIYSKDGSFYLNVSQKRMFQNIHNLVAYYSMEPIETIKNNSSNGARIVLLFPLKRDEIESKDLYSSIPRIEDLPNACPAGIYIEPSIQVDEKNDVIFSGDSYGNTHTRTMRDSDILENQSSRKSNSPSCLDSTLNTTTYSNTGSGTLDRSGKFPNNFSYCRRCSSGIGSGSDTSQIGCCGHCNKKPMAFSMDKLSEVCTSLEVGSPSPRTSITTNDENVEVTVTTTTGLIINDGFATTGRNSREKLIQRHGFEAVVKKHHHQQLLTPSWANCDPKKYYDSHHQQQPNHRHLGQHQRRGNFQYGVTHDLIKSKYREANLQFDSRRRHRSKVRMGLGSRSQSEDNLYSTASTLSPSSSSEISPDSTSSESSLDSASTITRSKYERHCCCHRGAKNDKRHRHREKRQHDEVIFHSKAVHKNQRKKANKRVKSRPVNGPPQHNIRGHKDLQKEGHLRNCSVEQLSEQQTKTIFISNTSLSSTSECVF